MDSKYTEFVEARNRVVHGSASPAAPTQPPATETNNFEPYSPAVLSAGCFTATEVAARTRQAWQDGKMEMMGIIAKHLRERASSRHLSVAEKRIFRREAEILEAQITIPLGQLYKTDPAAISGRTKENSNGEMASDTRSVQSGNKE